MPADESENASLDAALERLQQMVDALRPHVEDLESREATPTAEEMQEAQIYVEQLETAVAEVEGLLQSTGSSETPPALRAARKLLRRIAALDLVRRATELRVMIEELGSREEPPTEAELESVRQFARDLNASMQAMEEEIPEVRPNQKSVREAEKAVALSKTADVYVEAEASLDAVQELEEDPADVTDEEAAAARSMASDLKTSIDLVKQDAGLKKNDPEPAGLTRAREIVVRLVLIDLAGTLARLRPELERLEELDGPAPAAELDVLRPTIERLDNEIHYLDENLELDEGEELPTQLTAALDADRTFAALDLARSLADLRPVVEAYAQQQEPLTREQITELRAMSGILRPKIKAAQRTLRKIPMPETLTAPPEAHEANQLLQQVQNLVPDSPVATEEPVDAPDTQPVTRFFRFYGSLRVRALATPGPSFTLDGQTSRIGVRLQGGNWIKGVEGFGRIEVGFNFLEATGEFLKSIDEGRGLGEESLFFPRLHFLGALIKDRSITYGKQWASFYDVGVFSDQMPFFAGEGTGIYAAASDGGVAGTGRADDALQYRDALDIFKYSVQVQIRNETENDKAFADTIGGSVTWQATETTQVGGAFSVVRDGVPDPEEGQPKEDDRAFIIGYRYRSPEWYGAATVTLFDNHDRDNRGEYFGGLGIEWYGAYTWSDRLLLRVAISSLNPGSDYEGSYRIFTLTAGASYDLTERVRLLLLNRLDFSKLANASDRGRDIVSISAFYNF